MSSTFLCQCNRIAVPAVIEGNTMLVCRHLLQGSQYRMDPHHVPCGFRLEDTGPELQPTVRAAVLHRRPKAFQALALPPGSDRLDLYRPKNEIAASNSRAAQAAEDAMEIDDVPTEGAWIVHPEQRPLDLRALHKRCLMLERQLQASEEDRRQMKQRMVSQQEEMQQSARAQEERIRALEEQLRVRDRAHEEEIEYYRKKYESARTELHGLRRSTRNIVSNALQSHRTSSPSPI
ncbi:hypothetical protein ACGC1H_007120 [Rhizoctonia solani]